MKRQGGQAGPSENCVDFRRIIVILREKGRTLAKVLNIAEVGGFIRALPEGDDGCPKDAAEKGHGQQKDKEAVLGKERGALPHGLRDVPGDEVPGRLRRFCLRYLHLSRVLLRGLPAARIGAWEVRWRFSI